MAKSQPRAFMTPEIAQNILNFLDRCSITGHKERLAMNDGVEALVLLRSPKDKKPKKPKEKDGKTDTK